MSNYGRVKQMHNGWRYNTPNSGILLDLDSGVEYEFTRPPITQNVAKGPKWNVKVHDVVTFDVENGMAVNVVLHKKYRKGFMVN